MATDTAGNITRYYYDPDTMVLNSVKYPRDSIGDEEGEIDSRTYYTYYSMLRMASATANVRPSGTLAVNYGYDGDRMTSVRTPTTTYNFEYGDFGLTDKVRIGTRNLATYSYTEKNNFLEKLDYANDDSVEYTYNKYGQLRKQVYEDGAKVVYRYDNSGALAQVEDYATGILTKYMYDLSDRLMMYEEEAGEQNHRVRYYYDSMNNLTKVREGFDGVNRTTTYTYDKDNRVTGVSQSDTSEAYTYDDYGRFRKATLTHGNLTLEDIYTYQAPSDTQTAMQVYKQTTKINGAESAYRYTYDANGNITSVNDGTYTTTYVYDSANQLLRENNEKAGKTWGWTYDDGGNIRTKTEYAYTTGTPGTALDTTEYSYSASSWGDLLISHDGNTIVSDDNGNMLSYGDEKTFTWKHGRELSGMTDDSGSWTFEYNADGLRVYRSNGNTEYKYYYNGDKLTRMVVNGQNITFGYDANGTPQYVLYEGNRYFYLTNLQGDVTAIVSVNGNVVVEYSYDAWGNVLDITGVRADNLGKLNPLRYRGYVYDEETGLYYLQSRYYDPLIGRFINADVYTSTGQGFVGNNMFAYCGNNPAVYTDPTGSAFVGLGAQFDISTGAYECGVEVIVYWDKNVCSEGGPIVSVYTYEGMSVNLDEVLVNPQYVNVVNQLTLAVSANAGKDYDTMELIGLQATLFGTNASASVVGIWGYDNFDSTDDYAGPFTSYSGNYNHVKATWSYCDTCWSIAVGGTTETRPHLSFGQTNYTEVYNSSSR